MTPTPHPHPTLRPQVYVVAGLLVVGVGVGLWKLPLLVPLMGSLTGLAELDLTPAAPEPGPLPQLPDSFKPQPLIYGTPSIAKERPPVAQPLLRSTPAPPVQAALMEPLPGFLQPAPPPAQPPTPPLGTPASPPPPPPGQPQQPQQPLQAQQPAPATPKDKPVDPRSKKWDFLLKPDAATHDKGLDATTVVGEVAKRAEEQAIIKNAKWAMPAKPLITIYKSMELIGTLRRSINSDIPGIAQCQLSIPVFDKFGYSTTILARGTIAILKQKGKLEYGSTRVPMELDQLELPSGEVVVAKAYVEDSEGKTGLTGKVNNHYGKLILATAINAALSLGTNSLAGTPSGFYANPTQQAARDASQSTSQDIRKITDAQLKVPPTVEIKQGTPCLVQLDENITFSKKALVVP
jgi:type IV secretory pathway VirB10-like protein